MEEYTIESFGLRKNTKNIRKILSIKLKTLPQFIILNGNKVLDILKYISHTKDSLEKIIRKINLEKTQLSLLYLTFNKSFKRTLKTSKMMGMDEESIINNTLDKINVIITGVMDKIKKTRKKIHKEIKENIENFKRLDKHDIKVGELIKEAIEITCTYSKYDLASVFNEINLKDLVIPFVYFEKEDTSFFKIYKYFQPDNLNQNDLEWFNSLENWKEFMFENNELPRFYKYYTEIVHGKDKDKFELEQTLYKWMITQQKLYEEGNLDFLKMYNLLDFGFPLPKRKIMNKIILKYKENKDYKDIELYLDKNKNLNVRFNTTDNKNREKLLSKLNSSFKSIRLENPIIKENIITSSVSFKLDTFYNKYIFLDLVSNEPYFAKYLYVNEFEKVSKSKENTIWVYFKTPEEFSKGVTISITKSKSDNNIINLKIKKTNEAKIKQIITVMEELLKLYSEKKNKIIKYYKNYINNFAKIKEIHKERKKGIKKLDKDLFPKSIYARSCQKPKQPQLEYTIKKLDRDRVFRFPLGIKGKEPREYSCANDNYKYPGLKELANIKDEDREKLPLKGFVPCCYASKGGPFKKMQDYLNLGLKSILSTEKKVKKQTNIDETKYLITNGQTKKFKFKLFREGKFFRKGFAETKSKSNPNSFLYCLYYIYREEFPSLEKYFQSLNYKELDSFFNNERSKISKESKYISLCKQEMFDKTENEIMDIIKNNKNFFDPKKFINILSSKFSCNIFLFEKIDNKIKMVLPNHTLGYYHDLSNENSVLLYLNYGSISSKSPYPQCEIIAAKNKMNTLELIFDQDSKKILGFDLYSDIVKTFNILTSNFCVNRPLNVTNQNFNVAQKYFSSQYFDVYGKTRILNFKFKNSKGTLITSPIQPLELKSDEKLEIYKIRPELAEEFFNNVLNIKYRYIISNKERVAISGELNTIICKIPIISDKNITNKIAMCSDFNIPDKNSHMSSFNYKSKIARCLKSFVLWLYSKYKKENSGVEFDLVSDLKDFEKNKFHIMKNFSYEGLNNKLTLDSVLVYNKSKIIVDSEETRKRLIYFLLINIKNNSQFVYKYSEKEYIPSFFNTIQDFDEYHSEILLEGLSSFKNWYNKPYNLVLYDNIQPENDNIYMFSNLILNRGEMYMAINVENWQDAVNIVYFWNNNGYIPDYNDIAQLKHSHFSFFAYESKNNIEKFKIDNGNDKVNIVGYKWNKIPQYTALLKI